MNYKVLIVEDEKKIAQLIKMELEHAGCQATIAKDGLEGLQKASLGKFDVILLDLLLPIMDGIEVCKQVRAVSDIPIIMVTANHDVTDKIYALDSGANDYLTKPFDFGELLARIRVVVRSSSTAKPKQIEVLDLRLNLETFEVFKGNIEIVLSKKEFELLHYLMRNRGRVLSRDFLLENIWGYGYQGGSNVVDVTIRNLRIKLNDTGANRMISTVRGFGYAIGR